MKHVLYVIVQGEPIPKARPRLGRGGRVYTPEKTLAYEQLIALETRLAMQDIGLEVIDQPVRVDLFFNRSTHHKVDLDNLVKAALDGMNKVVFTDDKHVHELHAYKYVNRDNPNTVISVLLLDLENPKTRKKRS